MGSWFRRVGVASVMLLAGVGCAARTAPVQTQAALGKVVVYRNGVAYFERQAVVNGDTLVVRVPADRVDDFLKSLRVEDADTNRPLPVSFPTVEREGGEVAMRIRLPTPAPRAVRIAYVTESPAWKPSYRVELKPDQKAVLEGWAVVDNVSGEDWDRVTIGVGSTSALSFRYDLHSVRVVARETLGDDPALGLAPPTGGSPYAVAAVDTPLLGNFGQDALDRLTTAAAQGKDEASEPMMDAAPPAAEPATDASHGRSATKSGRGRAPAVPKMSAERAPAPPNPVVQLANRLRVSKERVRIEGFARSGEQDAAGASLRRANALRDVLVEQGVPAEQIEAIGTGKANDTEGVRVLAATTNAAQPAQAAGTTSDEPIGSAYFLASTPLTIKSSHSAMVSILQARTRAEQVYFFDPISARGSKRFAFRALRLENPSQYTLDQGPFTVYASGQFLGEGLSEPIPPKSTAFVPFALDRQVVVEPEVDTREEITRLTAIERGIVRTETRRIRRTVLDLHNQGPEPAKLYVRHAVAGGYTLLPGEVKPEKLGGAYLFLVTVPAKGALKLAIQEATPTEKSVDVNTEGGIREIAVFLEHSPRDLDPDLQRRLNEILELDRAMQDVRERIETVRIQMVEYRTRVDEINVQLVSLRRVTSAEELSRHLAKKMAEISERLQKATIEVTDLEAQLMTQRITLQDRVAELSL
ncbi:MAG: OmpA family protein [Polyangiaceae bacterium]|nr:OmpA family protein [Polyangiaceae bacterium]